jgi:hypothetical protein
VTILGWTLLLILVSPGLAHAYLDPTAGGFLLQLVLGGATGVVLLARLFARRLSEKVLRRLRGPK